MGQIRQPCVARMERMNCCALTAPVCPDRDAHRGVASLAPLWHHYWPPLLITLNPLPRSILGQSGNNQKDGPCFERQSLVTNI